MCYNNRGGCVLLANDIGYNAILYEDVGAGIKHQLQCFPLKLT